MAGCVSFFFFFYVFFPKAGFYGFSMVFHGLLWIFMDFLWFLGDVFARVEL